jgi:hypothetical protein
MQLCTSCTRSRGCVIPSFCQVHFPMKMSTSCTSYSTSTLPSPRAARSTKRLDAALTSARGAAGRVLTQPSVRCIINTRLERLCVHKGLNSAEAVCLQSATDALAAGMCTCCSAGDCRCSGELPAQCDVSLGSLRHILKTAIQ